ncbi:hypothetical protein [Calidifontibacter indicus]|uniref:hypothetical protein n=1 Tax=Calidifontibacter indicus TaxID=419650 RepID=UPI003D72F802
MGDNKGASDVDGQVWDAFDPDRTMREAMAVASTSEEAPEWLTAIAADAAPAWEALRTATEGAQKLHRAAVDAFTVLVDRGWAVTNMPTESLREAVRLVRAGDEDAADELLAAFWDGPDNWRVDRVWRRASVMGGRSPEYQALFGERVRLIRLAQAHHDAARFDASIPLMQAQVEGIAIDVTGGGQFFTTVPKRAANVVDPTALVSVEASLAALKKVYGKGVDTTQAAGALSRHGVAHGRELAYDTRINSAKMWSLLDAVVEWALPHARAADEQRNRDQEAHNAGSHEVDENGRRVDDREFAQTQDMFRVLSNAAMTRHRNTGRFPSGIVGGVYGPSDFAKRGLPADHGTVETVSSDGQQIMFHRTTVSGWVLGLSLTPVGDSFTDLLYAAPATPGGLPHGPKNGWGHSLPDWR